MHVIIPKQVFDDAIKIAASNLFPTSEIILSVVYPGTTVGVKNQRVVFENQKRCRIEGKAFNMAAEDDFLYSNRYTTKTNNYVVWLWGF